MRWQVSVLGPVEACAGSTVIAISQPKNQALLAMIAMSGRTVSITELIDGIWGANSPDSAIGAVRNLVWSVRRHLAVRTDSTDIVASVPGGYHLAIPVGTDAAIAERHRDAAESACTAGRFTEAKAEVDAALGLWRGDPLTGVPGPWAESQRSRLRRLHRALREQSIDIALALRDHDRAIAEAESLRASDPHCERLCALQMTALHYAGRRAEALTVYQHTRQRLVDDLGLEPGPALTELHRRILTESKVTLPAASTRDAPVVQRLPAQLPTDTADFTGRTGEAAALEIDLTPSGTVVVASVTGMPGVGKSALAVHISHRVRDRYPDGQFHFDLRGSRPDPVQPGDALAAFLRALGVPDTGIPPESNQRGALWRSMIDGRRMLVVLDDAYDAEQVAPLLPGGPGSAVLITGRRPIVLPGIRSRRLAVLDMVAGVTLLGRIVGHDRVAAEPRAARDLVHLCGHLPLAIRLAGGRIAMRPEWTLRSAADRITARRAGPDAFEFGGITVESAFRSGYARLDSEAAQAFRLLARVDTSVLTLPVIAGALERDHRAAERLCEDLVDHGMLEPIRHGHYRFHELLRSFARAELRQQAVLHGEDRDTGPGSPSGLVVDVRKVVAHRPVRNPQPLSDFPVA